MDFVRTTVRSDQLPALGMDAITADFLAAALVRGEMRGSCDYCGRVLYEGDASISLEEWSMSLRETLPTTMCQQCKDDLDDER